MIAVLFDQMTSDWPAIVRFLLFNQHLQLIAGSGHRNSTQAYAEHVGTIQTHKRVRKEAG